MEASSKKSSLDTTDDTNLNWLVYHKYNKSLKERMQFVNSIMDWKRFAEDTVEQKEKRVNMRNSSNLYTSLTDATLDEEAMAKEHFAVSKSALTEILEQAYFPLIDCQEHAELYTRLDMAIKQ